MINETKEEKQRRYEETKRKFQSRNYSNEDNNDTYKKRILNRMCAIYLVTKTNDFWANNPFVDETKKYNITDRDLFYFIPEYYERFVIDNSKKIADYDEDEIPEYLKITMNTVISAIEKKWNHYTVDEREKLGIIASRKEMYMYTDSIREKYKDVFKESPLYTPKKKKKETKTEDK